MPNKKNIVVIDIDGGNVYSLKRALYMLGYECVHTNNPERILNADKVFLPGVGAFKMGMKNLKEKNLTTVIENFVNSGKELMGICLGMQLLMDYSEEFGRHDGIGLVSGSVKPIKPSKDYKVPHMGWSSIQFYKDKNTDGCEEKLLNGIKSGKDCYFVHSYMVQTSDHRETIAHTTYGNVDFCSILRRSNIYGCQFHPEKSGKTGLKIIKNFIEGI